MSRVSEMISLHSITYLRILSDRFFSLSMESRGAASCIICPYNSVGGVHSPLLSLGLAALASSVVSSHNSAGDRSINTATTPTQMPSSSGATHRRVPPEIPVLDQALFDSYWCAETMKKRRGSRIDCPERKKLKFRLEPRVPEPAAPRPNVLYDLAALEMPTLDLTPTDGYHPNEGNFSTPIQITKISNEGRDISAAHLR